MSFNPLASFIFLDVVSFSFSLLSLIKSRSRHASSNVSARISSTKKNLLLFESMDKLACKIRCMADKLQSKAAAGEELSSIVAACLGSDGDHDGEEVASAETLRLS